MNAIPPKAFFLTTEPKDRPPAAPFRGPTIREVNQQQWILELHRQRGRILDGSQIGFQVPQTSKRFRAAFKATFGIALPRFVTDLKIQTAQELLARDGATPADVAQRVGYASYSSFRIHFKTNTSWAPKKYARNAAGRVRNAATPASR